MTRDLYPDTRVHSRCIALQKPHCHELRAICEFSFFLKNNYIQVYVSQSAPTCCPDPHRRCPLSSLAALHPSLPPLLVRGRSECLKCHISPLSSDLLFSQKQASMLLADPLWLQVDVMWHISSSITVGRWVRKAGTGERWGRGGPGPDSFCPGQLKSLQPHPPSLDPPPWPEALNPPPAVMDKKTNQHTRLACSSCTRGASERWGNMDQRRRIEGTRPLFSVFISLDCAALDYWVWVATLFTCIWMDAIAVWCCPNLTLSSGAERLTVWTDAGAASGVARAVAAGRSIAHHQSFGCLSSRKPERIMGNGAIAFDALPPPPSPYPPCSLLILPSAICEKQWFHVGQMETSCLGWAQSFGFLGRHQFLNHAAPL